MEILSSGNYTREINMASRKWLNTKSYLVKHIASSARLGWDSWEDYKPGYLQLCIPLQALLLFCNPAEATDE